MKLQAPTSKHQRSSKAQTPAGGGANGHAVAYPEILSEAWSLREDETTKQTARHPFDLEERTACFGEAVIRFLKKLPRSPGNDRIIGQLTGCATSVGANYMEANESVSKKDFRYGISRCVKEAKETKFFLRMTVAGNAELVAEARKLYREAHELHMIFAAMFRNGKT